MTRDQFKLALAEFLVVSVDSVKDDARLTDLGWDSLALLSVIGLAEETWGIEVSEMDLNACQTVLEMTRVFDCYWTES